MVAPILQPPDWLLPFHVFVDALDVAIGAILMQEKQKGWYRPIYYASKMLSPAEKNYTVTEREALGMVYALRKFRHYLLSNKVVFHVDHQALLYLVKKPQLTGRLARWMLLLQEFDFTIIHTPGKLHAIVDYLSRIEHGEEAVGVFDQLPDASIYVVWTFQAENWYDEMLNFLLDGMLPTQMKADQKKEVCFEEQTFSSHCRMFVQKRY